MSLKRNLAPPKSPVSTTSEAEKLPPTEAFHSLVDDARVSTSLHQRTLFPPPADDSPEKSATTSPSQQLTGGEGALSNDALALDVPPVRDASQSVVDDDDDDDFDYVIPSITHASSRPVAHGTPMAVVSGTSHPTDGVRSSSAGLNSSTHTNIRGTESDAREHYPCELIGDDNLCGSLATVLSANKSNRRVLAPSLPAPAPTTHAPSSVGRALPLSPLPDISPSLRRFLVSPIDHMESSAASQRENDAEHSERLTMLSEPIAANNNVIEYDSRCRLVSPPLEVELIPVSKTDVLMTEVDTVPMDKYTENDSSCGSECSVECAKEPTHDHDDDDDDDNDGDGGKGIECSLGAPHTPTGVDENGSRIVDTSHGLIEPPRDMLMTSESAADVLACIEMTSEESNDHPPPQSPDDTSVENALRNPPTGAVDTYLEDTFRNGMEDVGNSKYPSDELLQASSVVKENEPASDIVLALLSSPPSQKASASSETFDRPVNATNSNANAQHYRDLLCLESDGMGVDGFEHFPGETEIDFLAGKPEVTRESEARERHSVSDDDEHEFENMREAGFLVSDADLSRYLGGDKSTLSEAIFRTNHPKAASTNFTSGHSAPRGVHISSTKTTVTTALRTRKISEIFDSVAGMEQISIENLKHIQKTSQQMDSSSTHGNPHHSNLRSSSVGSSTMSSSRSARLTGDSNFAKVSRRNSHSTSHSVRSRSDDVSVSFRGMRPTSRDVKRFFVGASLRDRGIISEPPSAKSIDTTNISKTTQSARHDRTTESQSQRSKRTAKTSPSRPSSVSLKARMVHNYTKLANGARHSAVTRNDVSCELGNLSPIRNASQNQNLDSQASHTDMSRVSTHFGNVTVTTSALIPSELPASTDAVSTIDVAFGEKQVRIDDDSFTRPNGIRISDPLLVRAPFGYNASQIRSAPRIVDATERPLDASVPSPNVNHLPRHHHELLCKPPCSYFIEIPHSEEEMAEQLKLMATLRSCGRPNIASSPHGFASLNSPHANSLDDGKSFGKPPTSPSNRAQSPSVDRTSAPHHSTPQGVPPRTASWATFGEGIGPFNDETHTRVSDGSPLNPVRIHSSTRDSDKASIELITSTIISPDISGKIDFVPPHLQRASVSPINNASVERRISPTSQPKEESDAISAYNSSSAFNLHGADQISGANPPAQASPTRSDGRASAPDAVDLGPFVGNAPKNGDSAGNTAVQSGTGNHNNLLLSTVINAIAQAFPVPQSSASKTPLQLTPAPSPRHQSANSNTFDILSGANSVNTPQPLAGAYMNFGGTTNNATFGNGSSFPTDSPPTSADPSAPAPNQTPNTAGRIGYSSTGLSLIKEVTYQPRRQRNPIFTSTGNIVSTSPSIMNKGLDPNKGHNVLQHNTADASLQRANSDRVDRLNDPSVGSTDAPNGLQARSPNASARNPSKTAANGDQSLVPPPAAPAPLPTAQEYPNMISLKEKSESDEVINPGVTSDNVTGQSDRFVEEIHVAPSPSPAFGSNTQIDDEHVFIAEASSHPPPVNSVNAAPSKTSQQSDAIKPSSINTSSIAAADTSRLEGTAELHNVSIDLAPTPEQTCTISGAADPTAEGVVTGAEDPYSSGSDCEESLNPRIETIERDININELGAKVSSNTESSENQTPPQVNEEIDARLVAPSVASDNNNMTGVSQITDRACASGASNVGADSRVGTSVAMSLNNTGAFDVLSAVSANPNASIRLGSDWDRINARNSAAASAAGGSVRPFNSKIPASECIIPSATSTNINTASPSPSRTRSTGSSPSDDVTEDDNKHAPRFTSRAQNDAPNFTATPMPPQHIRVRKIVVLPTPSRNPSPQPSSGKIFVVVKPNGNKSPQRIRIPGRTIEASKTPSRSHSATPVKLRLPITEGSSNNKSQAAPTQLRVKKIVIFPRKAADRHPAKERVYASTAVNTSSRTQPGNDSDSKTVSAEHLEIFPDESYTIVGTQVGADPPSYRSGDESREGLAVERYSAIPPWQFDSTDPRIEHPRSFVAPAISEFEAGRNEGQSLLQPTSAMISAALAVSPVQMADSFIDNDENVPVIIGAAPPNPNQFKPTCVVRPSQPYFGSPPRHTRNGTYTVVPGMKNDYVIAQAKCALFRGNVAGETHAPFSTSTAHDGTTPFPLEHNLSRASSNNAASERCTFDRAYKFPPSPVDESTCAPSIDKSRTLPLMSGKPLNSPILEGSDEDQPCSEYQHTGLVDSSGALRDRASDPQTGNRVRGYFPHTLDPSLQTPLELRGKLISNQKAHDAAFNYRYSELIRSNSGSAGLHHTNSGVRYDSCETYAQRGETERHPDTFYEPSELDRDDDPPIPLTWHSSSCGMVPKGTKAKPDGTFIPSDTEGTFVTISGGHVVYTPSRRTD